MVRDRKTRGSRQERSDRTDLPSEPRPTDADVPTDLKDCPVCGHTMRAHSIERGVHETILNCPVPHPGVWDRDAFLPVNEFGMVLRTRDSEHPDEEADRSR